MASGTSAYSEGSTGSQRHGRATSKPRELQTPGECTLMVITGRDDGRGILMMALRGLRIYSLVCDARLAEMEQRPIGCAQIRLRAARTAADYLKVARCSGAQHGLKLAIIFAFARSGWTIYIIY